MIPLPDESLSFVRRLGSMNEAAHFTLFQDTNSSKGHTAGPGRHEIEWKVPMEFVSVAYDEPLWVVRAQRMAIGGIGIHFVKPIERTLPDRFLVTDLRKSENYQRGNVTLRWQLDSLFETPQFCTTLAYHEWLRTEHNWAERPSDLRMLNAAKTLSPRPYDVIGFYTTEASLSGAVEFIEQIGETDYLANIFALSANDRRLETGEPLWTRFTSMIGQTPVTAERHVFDVLELGTSEVAFW